MDDVDARNTDDSYRIIPIFEKAARMTAATKGIKVMVGSGADGSTLPHGAQTLEFEWLVKRAGLTTARVIQAGTMTNAEALGWQDRIGSIEKGKYAGSDRRIGRSPGGHHRTPTSQIRDEGWKAH